MTQPNDASGDASSLDLTITRTVPAPTALVWKAWTTPELLKRWWVPRPWSLAECELELRAGGMFRSVMRSPEGELFPSVGVFLEVVDQQKIVFTDTLEPGWRPGREPFMTAIITFEDLGGTTRYSALVMHKSAEDRERHVAMGFFDGWGKAIDQLCEVVAELT